jgi:hypothetical protein
MRRDSIKRLDARTRPVPNLLIVDRDIRTAVLEAGWDLEGMLEDFGCDGVKCEVRGCENESEHAWEQSEDEVRNVCGAHLKILEEWRLGDLEGTTRGLRLTIHWDSEEITRMGLGVRVKVAGNG